MLSIANIGISFQKNKFLIKNIRKTILNNLLRIVYSDPMLLNSEKSIGG